MKIFTLIFTAFLLVFDISFTQSASKADLTRPATVAADFLKGLEEMLSLESRRQYRQADSIKLKLAKLIADETIDAEVQIYGRSTANLSAEAIIDVQTGMVTGWAALINYYSSHFNYEQIDTIIPFLQEPRNDVAQIVIPVEKIKEVHWININVICVKENNRWKIKQIRLEPISQKKTQYPETQQNK